MKPIFVRCVQCDTSINFWHVKEHVHDTEEDT